MGKAWDTLLPDYSDDVEVKMFVQHVCNPSVVVPKAQAQFFNGVLRDCLVHQKIQILPMFLCLQQRLKNIKDKIDNDDHSVWDAKLLITYMNGPVAKLHTCKSQQQDSMLDFISMDFVSLVHNRFDEYYTTSGFLCPDGHLAKYLETGEFPVDREAAGILGSLLVFYGIPDSATLQVAKSQYLSIVAKMRSKFSPVAVVAIILPRVSTVAITKIALIWGDCSIAPHRSTILGRVATFSV